MGALLAVPGIGPWTAAYVRLRALGDPDVLPETDLGVRHAAVALGLPDRAARARRARPGVEPLALLRRPAPVDPTRGEDMSSTPYETTSVAIPGGTVLVVVDPDDGRGGGLRLRRPRDDVRLPVRGRAAARAPGGRADRGVRATGRRGADDYAAGDLAALDRVVVRQSGATFMQRGVDRAAGGEGGRDRLLRRARRRARAARVPSAPRGRRARATRSRRSCPCHRILRTDGSLGGYAYGLPVKEALLVHEGVRGRRCDPVRLR